MNRAVLDTSVIFKWYHHVDEEDLEAALILRDAFFYGSLSIDVPDLLIYEFANSLRYKEMPEVAQICSSMNSLWSLGLKIHPVTEELSQRIINLAVHLDISIYDATFAALSQALSSTLVTADRSLYRKVRDQHAVMLLSDITKTSG